ncbi:hypothetical protein V8C43DRAFT_266982 [Trichoderma afarasin]
MFRPRGNAGQARPPEAPAAEDFHQSNFRSARSGVELNTSVAPTSRATQQTMFHPVASASRLAHQDILQPVSQSTNNSGANNTLSTQSFHRPPRFLVSSRGNPEPINASAASTSRATRPKARLIDTIESDGTPPAAQPLGSIEPGDTPSLLAHVSAALTSHTIRPASRLGDSIDSDGTPPLRANASITSTSRIIRPGARLIDSIDSDGTSSLPTSASTTSTSHIIRPASPILQSIETEAPPPPLPTSRKTRRPMLQLLRDAGPANPEPVNIPSNSTARGPRPLPLPDRTETGRPTAPTTSTSRATYQTIPQPVSNAGPSRRPTATTSRIAQQPTLQPTRNAMPAHASTTSASRIAAQPTIQPMRNVIPAHASTTSSSRIATQPTIQPTRILPTQNPSASSSRIAAQPTIQPTRTLPTQNPSASSSHTSQQSAFRPLKTTAAPANTPTPSTSSSIFEFICLYSHDLRRKKKRWQDGKLKFHTFNKKYVVYDDGGGFVGDGHWQGDESEFTEGVEMNLDRGMVIVQVLECTGSKEQDLGEVLGKRVREVEERRVNAAAKNPASTVIASSNPAKRIRGIAAVVQAAPAPTTAPVVVAAAVPTTTTTTAIPLPRGGGAWSKHAVDLLGMTRPSR